MHTILSARIAKLNTDLLVPPSPKQLKSEILDLAKDCQVLPEQKFLLRVTARGLTSLVKRVFGQMAMIFPLTETGRRHVYLAVLAKLDADNRLDEMDEPSRIALLERLLTLRNADLITGTFGSNPPGYLRLITRLGDVARNRRFYLDLHHLLTEAPCLAEPLINTTGKDALSDELLEMLMALPRVPDAVKLADRFPDRGRLETFLQTYHTLTGTDDILEVHMTRIKNGESPDSIIEELYLSRHFGVAQIDAHPEIEHIATGLELIATAKLFHNCLRNYVSEALRGERQYYIWRKPGQASVIFEIRNDAPFGWYFSEANHAQNKSLMPDLYEELRLLLCNLGITRCHSMERLTRPFIMNDDDDTDAFDWLQI